MAIDENGVVTFNAEEQKKVDEIIQERLGREKAKYADYDELAEIAKELEEFGYQGSPAEKKAAIKSYKEQLKAQQELEELEEEAKTTGKDPGTAKAIKALEKKIADLEGEREAKKAEEKQKENADAAWTKQLDEFKGAYPDIDLDELGKNDKFLDFIEGSGWPLKKGYEKFLKFYGDAALETIVKVKSKETRSTSGGKGAKNSDGSSYGLTEGQKKMVEDWNRRYPKNPISYKDFANM